MSFDPVKTLTSHTVVLRQENIDTDQIIPARFLTTTSKNGLGQSVFYDWRYNGDGRQKNSSAFNGYNPGTHKILVAGSNFGCGSSREHAPWALYGFGFRAVISSDIADIFKSNALKNGLLAIEVDPKTHASLLKSPGAEIIIDLERQIVAVSNWEKAHFDVEPFARQCLMDGVDQLGALMSHLPEIEAFEATRP